MSAERTESRYVTVEPDVQIHFWDAGEKDAPALIFIPGLTFSGKVFKHQLEHFSKSHRVILVDPRGQRLSARLVMITRPTVVTSFAWWSTRASRSQRS